MACSWPISCISSNTRGLSSQGYGACQSDCWLSNTMAGRQVHGYHTRSASLPCEACSWNEDLVKSPNLEPAPPDSAASCIQLWQNSKTIAPLEPLVRVNAMLPSQACNRCDKFCLAFSGAPPTSGSAMLTSSIRTSCKPAFTSKVHHRGVNLIDQLRHAMVVERVGCIARRMIIRVAVE